MREFHVESVCEMYRRVSTERASGAGISFGGEASSADVGNKLLEASMALMLSDKRRLGSRGLLSKSI